MRDPTTGLILTSVQGYDPYWDSKSTFEPSGGSAEFFMTALGDPSKPNTKMFLNDTNYSNFGSNKTVLACVKDPPPGNGHSLV